MSEPVSFPTRVARHAAWRARRIYTVAAAPLRRGDRTVTMTPTAGLRFGNWLYLWVQAHQDTASGHPRVILEAPGMAEWLDAFPALRALTIRRDELRFHDRREWNDASWNQHFGHHYTRETLDAFIRDTIAPEIPRNDADEIVINVRRGDYYSQPHFRARYGFDQAGYLAEALNTFSRTERIRLVSDDPAWCRDNLDDLFRKHADDIVYDPQNALGNFQAICAARCLIGTNSTFSYWGGYVAGVMHSDAQVVMPRFHARGEGMESAPQLDPSWTIIEGHF